MNEKLQKYEEKMESALKHLNKELASIRAGRANPAILDKVTVDYCHRQKQGHEKGRRADGRRFEKHGNRCAEIDG